jgi:hypothetical protein
MADVGDDFRNKLKCFPGGKHIFPAFGADIKQDGIPLCHHGYDIGDVSAIG